MINTAVLLIGSLGGLLSVIRMLAPKNIYVSFSIVRTGEVLTVWYSKGNETWLFAVNVSEQGRLVNHMLNRPNGLTADDITIICSGMKQFGAKSEAIECANSL